MKLNRRKFCHLTVAGVLLATLPTTAESLTKKKTSLHPEYQVDLSEGKLRAEVFLKNTGSEALEIETRGGISSLYLRVKANDNKTLLQMHKIPENQQERMDLMSRIGPRPTWTTLKPGEKRRMGKYISHKLAETQSQSVRLSLRVTTKKGPIELLDQVATITRK